MYTVKARSVEGWAHSRQCEALDDARRWARKLVRSRKPKYKCVEVYRGETLVGYYLGEDPESWCEVSP